MQNISEMCKVFEFNPFQAYLFFFSLLLVLGRCLPDITALGNIPDNFANVPGLPSTINDTINVIKNGTG